MNSALTSALYFNKMYLFNKEKTGNNKKRLYYK